MTPSPRPTTPLRQRMIEDMKLRNLSPHTIQAYVDRVAAFAKHFGKSPQLLGPKEVRTYLVFLVEEKRVSWSVPSFIFLIPVHPRSSLAIIHSPAFSPCHDLPRDGPVPLVGRIPTDIWWVIRHGGGPD